MNKCAGTVFAALFLLHLAKLPAHADTAPAEAVAPSSQAPSIQSPSIGSPSSRSQSIGSQSIRLKEETPELIITPVLPKPSPVVGERSTALAATPNGTPDSSVGSTPPPPEVRKATPTVAKRPTPPDQLSLQIDFAESALAITKDLPSRGQVIALYERALAAACPGKRARCNEIVERLLQLDTGNVPALCQKFGLQSAECREVIAAQERGWYDIDAARWRTETGFDGGPLDSSDLANAIELKRIKPELDKLIAARDALVRQTNRETAQELALDKILADGIALTCTHPKVIFLAKGPVIPAIVEPVPTAGVAAPVEGRDLTKLTGPMRVKEDDQPGNSPAPAAPVVTDGSSPFDAVLNGLAALPTATPKPLPTKPVSRIASAPAERLRRIRAISNYCYDFTRVALSLRPKMVQARCAVEGWYAPACRAPQGQPTGASPGNSGGEIDSF